MNQSSVCIYPVPSAFPSIQVTTMHWVAFLYYTAGSHWLSSLSTGRVQFSSVAQSCLTLCDPMDGSTPGLPVHQQLRVYSNLCPRSRWCHPTTSSSLVPFSSHLQFFSASGSFQMSWLFIEGGQNIGASASASVLPMNIEDWFPLGWTGLILPF